MSILVGFFFVDLFECGKKVKGTMFKLERKNGY